MPYCIIEQALQGHTIIIILYNYTECNAFFLVRQLFKAHLILQFMTNHVRCLQSLHCILITST